MPDNITLGGTTFRVSGPVVGKPISEFTTGMKVGRATYDERLHAFWLVLDDFSGGVGRRRLDIREEMGTVWDNEGGVDLRRAQHITLPPLRTIGDIAEPTGYDYEHRWPSQAISAYSPQGGMTYLGFGSGIYDSADGGTTITLIKNIANADMIARIQEYTDDNNSTYLYAFPEGTGVTPAYYERATGFIDPNAPSTAAAWAQPGGTTKEVWDAIVYDGKLVGTTTWSRIIYTVNGKDWNIDLGDDPVWKHAAGRICFVGVAMGPWGGSGIYFMAPGQNGSNSLWCLDFYAYEAIEIGAMPGTNLLDACIWNGSVVCTDGFSVYQYTTGASETVREIGLPHKSGLPPCFQQCMFLRLFSVGAYLYCVVHEYGTKTQLWAYNGAGWSPLGPQETAFGCLTASGLSHFNLVFRTTQRRICLLGNTDHTTNTNARKILYDLPQYSDTPTVGIDNFEDGPLSFITGWIDGGFHEVDGTLYRVNVDGYNFTSTETVKVEYQLDNAESSSWVQLRSSADAADVFDSHTKTLYFHATDPTLGIKFRSVRFKVTLDRGNTATKSPELMALILVFDKKPELRTAWSFRIDINGMLEAPSLYQIDAANPTVSNIWGKLKTIWETYPLVTLVIPSLETGVKVKLTDALITLDDFRTAVAGRGYVDVQCLEPI